MKLMRQGRMWDDALHLEMDEEELEIWQSHTDMMRVATGYGLQGQSYVFFLARNTPVLVTVRKTETREVEE